jgi:hypothetical protein
MQASWVVSHNALFVAPATPAPFGQQTTVVRETLVGPRWIVPFLLEVVTGAVDGGVTGRSVEAT